MDAWEAARGGFGELASRAPEWAIEGLRGELQAVDAKVDVMDDRVATRHAENQRELGELRGALGAILGRRDDLLRGQGRPERGR